MRTQIIPATQIVEGDIFMWEGSRVTTTNVRVRPDGLVEIQGHTSFSKLTYTARATESLILMVPTVPGGETLANLSR